MGLIERMKMIVKKKITKYENELKKKMKIYYYAINFSIFSENDY